jgi:hypothetical protein
MYNNTWTKQVKRFSKQHRLLTDFVCLYTYEFLISLVRLLLPLFIIYTSTSTCKTWHLPWILPFW